MGEYLIQKDSNGKLIICKVLAEFNSEDKDLAFEQLINLKTGYLKENELGKPVLKQIK